MAETARYRVIQNLLKGLCHEASRLRLVFESKYPPTGPLIHVLQSLSNIASHMHPTVWPPGETDPSVCLAQLDFLPDDMYESIHTLDFHARKLETI
jgi:hypothetical protein